MTIQDSKSFSRELVITLGCLLLGDKAVVVSQLILRAYDAIRGVCPDPSGAKALEFSLVGVALGSAATTIVLIATKREDATTILGRLALSCVAALLSIAESAYLSEKAEQYAETASRGFFFLFVSAGLLLVPMAVFRGQGGQVEIDPALSASLALIVGAVLGFATRQVVTNGLLHLGFFPDFDHPNKVLDALRFRPDTLVILGSAWAVVSFHPQIRPEKRAWSRAALLTWTSSYVVAAGFVGYCYCRIFEHGSDADPSHELGLAFSLVAVSPLIGTLPFARHLARLPSRARLLHAASCFLAVGTATLLTIGRMNNFSLGQRIALAGALAAAGAVTAGSMQLSLHWYRRLAHERVDDERPTGPRP